MFILDVCEDSTILKVIYFVMQLLEMACYLVPVVLIVMGMYDFFKAFVINDDSNRKKSISIFIRRCIGAVCIMLVPSLVSFGFGMLSDDTRENYLACITNANPTKIAQLEKEEKAERAAKK